MMRSLKLSRWLVPPLILVAQHAVALEWEIVARPGSPAPGPQDGAYFLDIGAVFVDSDGEIVFYGSVGDDMSWYADSGLYRWKSGTDVSLLTSFDADPTPFGDPPIFVEAGWSAIGPRIPDGFLVDRPVEIAACPSGPFDWQREASFVVDETGNQAPLIVPGMPAPGMDPGWIFVGRQWSGYANAYAPSANQRGDLAFLADTRLADPCEGDPLTPLATVLFGPDGVGGFTAVAVDEQAAPGAPPGTAMLLDSIIGIDEAGGIAFEARLRLGPSGPISLALYRWDAAHGIQLVVRNGDPAPAGGVFSRINNADAVLGPGGHLLFEDDSHASQTWNGLFQHDAANGLHALMRPGDTLPGLADDVVVQNGGVFAVNASGEAAFVAVVAPADSPQEKLQGLWGPDASGALTLRLLSGDPLPGLGELSITEFWSITLDEQRTMQISGILSGPGVDTTNRHAQFLLDASGNLRLLGRSGDVYEIAPGEFRWISYGDIRSDPEFHHFATLGSHFPFNPVLLYAAIPEPGSAITASLAILTLFVLRRRR